jgi:hypothetical protein
MSPSRFDLFRQRFGSSQPFSGASDGSRDPRFPAGPLLADQPEAVLGRAPFLVGGNFVRAAQAHYPDRQVGRGKPSPCP